MDVGDQGNGGWKVTVVASILVFMLLTMVLGRLVSRALKKSRLQNDDFMLLVATVLSIALCAIGIALPRISGAAPYIGGNATASSVSTPDKKAFLAWTILYGLAIAAAKWAILLLYLRVFTTSNRWLSFTLYSMGFLVTATTIANTLTAIFECTPVSYLWSSSETNGSCIDVVAFNKYMTIPNIISGIVMILMPLPPVFQLNISTIQKVGLSATFLHGIIGVIASIARLWVLSTPGTRPIPQTIWTLNEPTNYVIAACLPTLRPIFVRILPESFFVLSKRRSRSTSKPYTSSLKISWRRGSFIPSFNFERERFAIPQLINLGAMGMLESPKRSTWHMSSDGDRKGSRDSTKVVEVRRESVPSSSGAQTPVQGNEV